MLLWGPKESHSDKARDRETRRRLRFPFKGSSVGFDGFNGHQQLDQHGKGIPGTVSIQDAFVLGQSLVDALKGTLSSQSYNSYILLSRMCSKSASLQLLVYPKGKVTPPGIGPQVIVLSICRSGNPFRGYPVFDHSHVHVACLIEQSLSFQWIELPVELPMDCTRTSWRISHVLIGSRPVPEAIHSQNPDSVIPS